MPFTMIALSLAAIRVLYGHQVAAFPTDIPTTGRTHQPRGSSKSGPNGRPTVIIIAVLALVLAIFSFAMIRGYLKRQRKKWGSTEQLQSNDEGSRMSPDNRPRTTASYSRVGEQTDSTQTQIETREVGEGSNNTPAPSATRHPRVNRWPSQNSSRSLPSYRERLPDGEMVLVGRVERPSMSEAYEDRRSASGDETENTPLTNAHIAYTDTSPDRTPDLPRTTSISGNRVSYVESLQGQTGHQGTAEESEPIDARVPAPDVNRAILDGIAPPYRGRDAPSYDETSALATVHTANATSVVPLLERNEQT
ncbi:unnamed protein product [Rhizoctonia solani]|uniref:Uncharacterized protein n=1 Tax=Rhizoctonia solani TaxID=456999 RepID=A0A8H2WE08_9AGAM|nr:unnamed protein product [Rhizoctonia solani]